jgi:hypothetical protein
MMLYINNDMEQNRSLEPNNSTDSQGIPYTFLSTEYSKPF